MAGRIKSFSVAPYDDDGELELSKLEEYSKRTGITFSYLILKAITNLNKELKL